MDPHVSEWLLKIGGPLGLVVVLLLLYYWKVVLPEQKRLHDEYKAALTSALEDARNERDAVRALREQEVTRFLESLRYRDEQFKAVADAIANRPRRREQ
jgi:hypothetical protein